MADWRTRARIIFAQPGFPGLLGAAFALGVGFSFVSPYLSLWATEHVGMSPKAFGLFMTATSLSSIVVATTLARWSDTHLPRKTMLLLGGTGGLLGYSGYAIFRNTGVLLAVGCTLIAIASICFSQLFAYTRERYYNADIPGLAPGFLMSVVRVCFSIAWTAGPSVGAWMMVQFDYRGLFLGAAVLFLVFVVAILRSVPHEPRSAAARAVAKEPVWRVLTRGDIVTVVAAFLLVFSAHIMNGANLPLMLTNVLGATRVDVGIAFGIGPLVEIPLMLWFGLLAGRGHSLALLRLGAVVTLLYFVLLFVAREPWHVFLAQVLHGTSFAIISNVGIMFVQDMVPGQAGLATAAFANAANAGNLIGYLGFWWLVQPLGNRGLTLASAALTLGMAVIMFLYRPRNQAGLATAAVKPG